MKIAIQGHKSRGKEVIQILESLGGKNKEGFNGSKEYYFINSDGYIRNDYKSVLQYKGFKTYTLEEFEREFPFKIGDRVISATTNFIGTITKLKESGWYYVKHDSGNLVCVFRQHLKLYKEMKEERNVTLTLEKAQEWYKKGGELKEIALQAFSEEELNSLPRSWEEFCNNYPVKSGEIFIDISSKFVVNNLGTRDPIRDKNICPSQKSAEAHLAMIQLEQLRDCWRQGWEPDWSDAKQAKCYICYYQGKFKISTLYETRRFLSFPTKEMAEEFLECFRDLIAKAGDLI